MEIISSYKVKIVASDISLKDTVSIYREALAYLIDVVNKNYDAMCAFSTKSLERQHYIEKLIHGNKNNAAKYPDFDKRFCGSAVFGLRV